MTELEKAAQQALEWIKANTEHDQLCDLIDIDEDGNHKPCSCGLNETITALTATLEQTTCKQPLQVEQPARAVKTFHGGKPHYVAEQQPAQEPVAHVFRFDPNGRPRIAWDNAKDIQLGDKLYTRPQSMTPLTDEQIFDLAEPFGAFEFGDAQGHMRLAFARAIEAKLKEKNHGG